MVVAKGTSLGPYEIIAHLGAGGMGEVWRARDRRIGRDVAIKLLPQVLAPSEEALQRFEQEARSAGSLNHPGLVTIFDVGTDGPSPYIVMELLEGETLRDVIGDPVPRGVSPRKAVDYAVQIASALAAVHDRGIIHRDLKPENLFVTSDRRVKILDFGLAKLAPDATDADGRRRVSKHLTSAGIAVGTPSYMSPEQVRAAPLDHRTDIFSLGSVLHEMLTGVPVFERDSAIETMHAVLNAEVPPIESPDVSPELEATVRHCLEKNPRDRFQSARDLAFQLELLPEMKRAVTSARKPSAERSRWRRAGTIVLPVLAAFAGGGLALRGLRDDPAPVMPRRYTQLTSSDGMEILPALAPDGKSFAFVASRAGNRDIYVQRVDGRTPINITADSTADDSEPAFSPDGSQIAFRSEREGGGIFLIGATGESPRRLTEFGHNPAWSPDGKQLVFATEGVELLPSSRFGSRMSELWLVDVSNGTRRALVQANKGGPDFGRDSDCVQPSWSPNGKRIAFWGISSLSGHRDIWTIDPAAREPKKTVVRVSQNKALHWNPVWSPDGKYLYYGSDLDGTLNLWRVAMDEDAGTPAGAPEPVALPASVAGNFSFARSGELSYVTTTNSNRIMAMPFDVEGRTIGAARQLFGGSQEIATFQPSPNGKLIAYSSNDQLFVADVDGMRIRQLTTDAAKYRGPYWSPDGKTLFFYSNREGDNWHIWSIHEDGSRLTRITNDADLQRIGARSAYIPVALPDGHTLLLQTDREMSALLDLARPPGRQLEPLPVFLSQAEPSPDGQLIAARDGTPTSLSGPITLFSVRDRRRKAFLGSGSSPHWTPDGKKVVYFDREAVLIYDVATGKTTTVPFVPPAGLHVDLRGVTAFLSRDVSHLSRDAATLYVRQTIEQSDIWMARFLDPR